LGFRTLSQQWLDVKASENISDNTLRCLREHIGKGVSVFGDTSVKGLRRKDFEFFLSQFKVSAKSKANYLQTLKQFFRWLLDNEEIEKLPKFPKVDFEWAQVAKDHR
jgi:site-specific recombinase XerD